MRLVVKGGQPPAHWAAAIRRGVRRMGGPDVEVVLATDFDAVVRDYTGLNTYSSDRGTGTVGAKTLTTSAGPVIVVNMAAIREADASTVERLLAHEAAHVLIDERGETLSGRERLCSVEWQWYLVCLAGLAVQELRVEQAVGEAGYPFSDSSSAEHAIEVLYATTVDLILLLQDPQVMANPQGLMDGVHSLADRLTKVLAYLAARTIVTGRPPNIEGQGPLAAAAWDDYVAPTWNRRLALYRTIPPATVRLPSPEWDRALLAGLALERALIADMGFVYRNLPNGEYGFYRSVSDGHLNDRIERAIAQGEAYAQEELLPGGERGS